VQFVSTRGESPIGLDEALVNGIASDGGLYVPVELPSFSVADFDNATSIGDVAAILLRPFFSASSLVAELDEILAEQRWQSLLAGALSWADGGI
jgi:threonine synthase